MKNLIPFILVLLTTQANAQELKFTFGPESEDATGWVDFYNTSLRKGYEVISPKKILISPIDEYLTPGTQKEIKTELFSEEGTAYLEGFVANGEKNYMLYSKPEKKADQLAVYIQELSADMVLLGTAIRITSFTGAKLRKANPSSFGVYLGKEPRSTFIVMAKSVDQKQIVLIRQNDAQLDIKAISLEKGEMWSTVIQLNDLKNEVFKLRDFQVAENGNIYVLGSYYYLNDAEKFPFLAMYNPTTKKQRIHNFDSDGNERIWQLGYNLQFMNDGSLMLAGLTNDVKKETLSYSVYRVDQASLELEKFAAALIENEYNVYSRKGVFSPAHIRIHTIVPMKNGNFALSIENGFNVRGELTASTYSSATHIIALDKTGVEQWKTTIQKEQMYGGLESLIGSAIFYKENSLYLLYNEHSDNANLAPTVKQKERVIKKQYRFTTVQIDEMGNAKKITLLKTEKDKVSSFNPRTVQQIEKNLYQLEFKIGEKFKLATLSLD
jgi:hypothetical protein